jgi:hypothetical protein
VLVAVVLVALVLLAAASGRWGLPGAVALAVVSVLWLLVNKDAAEGPVLWSVSSHHGLTATDLGGVAGLGVAAWRGWRARRRRSAADDGPAAEQPGRRTGPPPWERRPDPR